MTDTRQLLRLPSEARELWEVFSRAGQSCFFVGGCVRDALLGEIPGDYDICTPLKPEEITALFQAYSVVPTGIRHGTVTVVVRHRPFEVTTFRIDGDYTDGRHPNAVAFTDDLQKDLARRDFTVNAMAWNPCIGLVDPYGGREDLQKRVIRCVGEPMQRFNEDALRIVRALRFSARLDFAIEDATASAARALSPTLSKVSRERLLAEYRKLLLGDAADRIHTDYPDILANFLPPISAHPPLADLPPQLAVRFAALYGSSAEDALRTLKAEKRLIEETAILAEELHKPMPQSEEETHHRLIALGRKHLPLFDAALSVAAARGESTAAAARWKERILLSRLPLSVGELAVRGEDLLPLCRDGREVGEKQKLLLAAVADKKTGNEKNALLSYLRAEKT